MNFVPGDLVELSAAGMSLKLPRHNREMVATGKVVDVNHGAGLITVRCDGVAELTVYAERFWQKRSCEEAAKGVKED